jgi:Cu-processing system permease protein
MNAVAAIAAKEIREGLRNRWIVATTLLLAALALTLSFLGSAPTGTVGASPLDVMVVSLSSLTIFLVPLIALLLAHDAIVGEAERGTLLLLLAYPVRRAEVVLGKFLGHIAILAVATVVGYGAAGLTLAVLSADALAGGVPAFAAMLGASVLLGAAFLAIGYLVSAFAPERGIAAGIAVGIWLVYVLIYDMVLLGILVLDQGRLVTPPILHALVLLSPTDIYRLLNLTSSGDVQTFAGMAGLAETAGLGRPLLVAALAAWVALPLAAASTIFARRDL